MMINKASFKKLLGFYEQLFMAGYSLIHPGR